MNTSHLPPLILGLPAMGVLASFHARFADALSAATDSVIEFADLPGQGGRPERARDGADFGYREIVEAEPRLDRAPACRASRSARRVARPQPRRAVRSGCERDACRANRRPRPDRRRDRPLARVAAGRRWRTWAVVQAIQVVAALWPWYRGRLLGFGGEQSPRFMRDWGHNATTGGYQLEGSRRGPGEIERAPHAVMLPVRMLGLRDDPVAPDGARAELIARLPCARVSHALIEGVPRDGATFRGRARRPRRCMPSPSGSPRCGRGATH